MKALNKARILIYLSVVALLVLLFGCSQSKQQPSEQNPLQDNEKAPVQIVINTGSNLDTQATPRDGSDSAVVEMALRVFDSGGNEVLFDEDGNVSSTGSAIKLH